MIYMSIDDVRPLQAGVRLPVMPRRSGAHAASAGAVNAPPDQEPAADGRLSGCARDA